MLGGINRENCWGVFNTRLYLINALGDIEDRSLSDNSNYQIYTLEEFLEKFPYKVGDKAQHKGATSCGTVYVIEQMKWEDNQVKYVICDLYWKNCKCTVTAKDLQPCKEETMEDNIKEKCDLINFNSHYIFDFADKVELILKDDWEVKNEDGRIYVVRKQLQYPKTYNECWKILDTGEEEMLFSGMAASEEVLFDSFIKLKRCRDAYWKIAGDWKPDFTNKEEKKFTISFIEDEIYFSGTYVRNSLLVFPTIEMRDAFYENFRDLIEICKELV